MSMDKGFYIWSAAVVAGSLGFQELNHHDANLHSHQEPPGILDPLQGRDAMTQVSSGPMWSSPPTACAWSLDIEGVSARNERRTEALRTSPTPLSVYFS